MLSFHDWHMKGCNHEPSIESGCIAQVLQGQHVVDQVIQQTCCRWRVLLCASLCHMATLATHFHVSSVLFKSNVWDTTRCQGPSWEWMESLSHVAINAMPNKNNLTKQFKQSKQSQFSHNKCGVSRLPVRSGPSSMQTLKCNVHQSPTFSTSYL